MPVTQGFPPVASRDSKVLILGSMPGNISLKQQQYYAHPRNSFWKIMGEMIGFHEETTYEQRLKYLFANRIALWDVLKTCYRDGSLDNSIDENTITLNAFDSFYRRHPEIRAVFFNGAKAEQVYRKYVLRDLPVQLCNHVLQRLPSTSPANARLTLSAKLEKWRVVYDQASKT